MLKHQTDSLLKKTVGWDRDKLESNFFDFVNDLSSDEIKGDKLYDSKVGLKITKLSSLSISLILSSTADKSHDILLQRYLISYAKSMHLHYKSLKAVFKKEKNENLFAIMLSELGFSTCAAIYTGLEKEAKWMCKEYVRHIDEGYECPYSIDNEFHTFCYFLAQHYLTEITQLDESQYREMGWYSSLASAFEQDDIVPVMDRTLTDRVDKSYEAVIVDSGDAPWFCGGIFKGLYPFEILAFKTLYEKFHNKKIESKHPLLNHLRNLDFTDNSWNKDFFDSLDGRLDELLIEQG